MDLVVGASESTVKSLLGKLGGLLAQEYTLIRGVAGDLQYITDELRTMQSFLRDLGDAAEQDHRMKDWMKQIRDMTYDVEDCVDDSGHRIRNPRWLRGDMCCYLLVSSVYEVATWGPRRDVAGKISDLRMRAQQISERRQRYGVSNPETDKDKKAVAEGFDVAGNQDRSLELVAAKDPVGVDKDMEQLEKWVTDKSKKAGVLSIVGYGGVGKTSIATALYKKLGDRFGCRAMVTVSQSSNIEAILNNIKSQVKPPSNDHEQRHGGSSQYNCLASALRGLRCKCRCFGTLEEKQGGTKRNQLNEELKDHFQKNSYLVVIDDVWSATTLEDIRKAFPQTDKHSGPSRMIVTTRFPAVATTRRGQEGDLLHTVNPLSLEKSQELFNQAHSESKPSQNLIQASSAESEFSKHVSKVCGGLPLAIVAMAGYVACNAHKQLDWGKICTKLFPDKKRREELESGEAGKDTKKGLTQEELGRIVSHCYNDMPAEIITCSLYLSIFPKGSRISRKRLIGRWIAEGFVSEKDGMSVEDVAETYFGHLVRRKMMRPVEHSSSGKIKQCVVHDMVLEHIVSNASEENFITVVGGHWLMNPPSSKVRRLSLQGSDPKHAKDTEKMNLTHVRSLTLFESLKQLPSNSFKFGKIVQVLDLEGCTDLKEQHTEEMCGMLLLKYLSLRRTDTRKLPKTIGKLENLETLDLRETKIDMLPKEVCGLERLVNILGGDKETRRALKLPQGFVKKQKIKALRILSGIEIVEELEDLHHLTDLRKLAIYKLQLEEDASFKLSSSIQYLCGYSLHTLVIHDESSKFLKCLDKMTSPPESLVSLELSGMMVQLPVWIKQLYALSKLTLSMTALRKDNLIKLSELKTLFSLTFTLAAKKQGPETMAILAKNKLFSDGQIIIPDGGFENLKLLRLCASLIPFVSFSENAMAKLERLELRFKMLEGIYGAENLASLEEVYLRLNDKEGEVMTKQIVQEIKSAVEGVPAKKPMARIILHVITTD